VNVLVNVLVWPFTTSPAAGLERYPFAPRSVSELARDERLALRMLGEDEVEAALEDLRGGRAGAGVRERVLRGVELLEQPA
jgi:hypothetical protein